VAPPGAEFHYTELGYQVAGAAAEVAGGGSWYELFERYLGGPLELAGTRWFNTYSTDPQPPNPLIAVGSVTCANDLSKFAAMVLAGGEHARGDGAVLRVLSAAAVADLARYQDIGDTSKDKVFGVVSGAMLFRASRVQAPAQACR
jgi:CubicO group peptidase (beta-lactamase class C family)